MQNVVLRAVMAAGFLLIEYIKKIIKINQTILGINTVY